MNAVVRAYNDRPRSEVTPNGADDASVAGGLFGFDLWSWMQSGRPWRVAESLIKLRDQINQMAPNRSKLSDGTIGDTSHKHRPSDHNPHIGDSGVGVVSALDITHDAIHGCDASAIAESLRHSQDVRVKYVIWNRRIFSSLESPWTWRDYEGVNPHDKHVHISVMERKDLYDSTNSWTLSVRS